MKKIFLLIALAIGVNLSSSAQFALGLKLGYNGTKLTTNIDSVKADFNNGFHVGAWAHFGKRLYLAPELLYTMSGTVFTKEGKLATENWKQKVTIGTMDIPILVGFKIIHNDLITWRIELGPEASIVVNKKVADQEGVPPLSASDIKTANWYVLGGTGIDILFLTFDIRYKYGLSQLVEDVGNYTFDTKNNQFLVSVGFRIFGNK